MRIHKSEQRGSFKNEWLDTKYSFSFSNYFNPERMGFGALKVVNDDIIAPGGGFGMHPHENMEIITIVLKGGLAHKDSTGGKGVLTPEEVQVMSAGSGVLHSEYNASDNEEVELLQLWIETANQDVQPRYDQKKFEITGKTEIVGDNSLMIHQDARIYLIKGEYEEAVKVPQGFGHFVFCIEGKVRVNDEILKRRDSAEITDDYKLKSDTYSIIIEIPI